MVIGTYATSVGMNVPVFMFVVPRVSQSEKEHARQRDRPEAIPGRLAGRGFRALGCQLVFNSVHS